MKNKIPLFMIVFITSLIIAIYHFDVLSSFVTEWTAGKHYFGKLIFVIIVFTVLFSLTLTFIIDWIIKIVFGRKG
jgi:hypothetical protein